MDLEAGLEKDGEGKVFSGNISFLWQGREDDDRLKRLFRTTKIWLHKESGCYQQNNNFIYFLLKTELYRTIGEKWFLKKGEGDFPKKYSPLFK